MTKCDKCKAPATINWQLVWVRWDVDKDGDLMSNPTRYGNCHENQFYCDKCYKEELEEEMWRWDQLHKDLAEMNNDS